MTISKKDLSLLLEAYKALLSSRKHIEVLGSEERVEIEGVLFQPNKGACNYIQRYFYKKGGDSCLLVYSILFDLNVKLFKKGLYPIKEEDFYAKGNKYNTLSPTHNAIGRWRYIETFVEYLEGELHGL